MRARHFKALAMALALVISTGALASQAEELLKAVRANDTATIDRLLQANPESATAPLPDGTTALTQAAYLERPALVERLRKAAPTLSFFEACIVGDVAQVRKALALGQNVDQLSPDGFSPLGLAVFFRQPEVAKVLIDAGANVRARSNNTLRVAPIHSAIARGDLAMLQTLLLSGADPDQTQQRLLRPIHEAAAAGSMPIVAMLLMFGADVAAPSEDGRTPADFAAGSGHAELAKRLTALAARSR